jgi:hypothetical protein
VVITITQAGGFYHPNFDYTIDGGNLVSLSGAHANRLFTVKAGRALTLTNITLIDGYAAAGGDFATQGGAILNEGILLVLDHVTIRGSRRIPTSRPDCTCRCSDAKTGVPGAEQAVAAGGRLFERRQGLAFGEGCKGGSHPGAPPLSKVH